MDDNTKQPTVEKVNTNEPAVVENPVKETVEAESTPNTNEGEVKSDADSRLSEAGDVSSESTSPDVHEPDRAGGEQNEPAELENQVQTNEPESTSEEPVPGPAISDKPDVPGARWYVVHTYSGHENKVAATLKQRVESEHLENK